MAMTSLVTIVLLSRLRVVVTRRLVVPARRRSCPLVLRDLAGVASTVVERKRGMLTRSRSHAADHATASANSFRTFPVIGRATSQTGQLCASQQVPLSCHSISDAAAAGALFCRCHPNVEPTGRGEASAAVRDSDINRLDRLSSDDNSRKLGARGGSWPCWDSAFPVECRNDICKWRGHGGVRRKRTKGPLMFVKTRVRYLTHALAPCKMGAVGAQNGGLWCAVVWCSAFMLLHRQNLLSSHRRNSSIHWSMVSDEIDCGCCVVENFHLTCCWLVRCPRVQLRTCHRLSLVQVVPWTCLESWEESLEREYRYLGRQRSQYGVTIRTGGILGSYEYLQSLAPEI